MEARPYCWGVEHTHAWSNRFRRLPIHYERHADTLNFNKLSTSFIALNMIIQFC